MRANNARTHVPGADHQHRRAPAIARCARMIPTRHSANAVPLHPCNPRGERVIFIRFERGQQSRKIGNVTRLATGRFHLDPNKGPP